MRKGKTGIRLMGHISVVDSRGYAYLPKVVRQEITSKRIPFLVGTNCVLLVQDGVDPRVLIESIEVLLKNVKLRTEGG